jgi:ribosomal protein S12 methylthiotransferase
MSPISLPIVADGFPKADLPSSPTGKASKGSFSFVSLGCPKNTVDSEQMLGLLAEDGYELVSDSSKSDLVVINTCGFIDRARAESFAVIDEMLDRKRRGLIKGVVVTGCLAERQREAVLEARPEIDALIGVFGRDEVTRVADRIMGNMQEQRTVFRPAPIRALADNQRLRITPKHFAYLKISEGCDRLCTFCAIPKMRGRHASKPIESILDEARQLAATGVKELIIVAQDTTYYGIDLYGQPRLAELLTELNRIDGIQWIRLMYFYPMYIDQRLLEVMASSERILPYVDIPLQHADDQMLRRMARRVNRQQIQDLLGMMQEQVPGIAIRTTFITGFPGETDQQFETLARFVQEQKFPRAGVFTYSLESDTPAARLPDFVPEGVALERQSRLMELQQASSFAFAESLVGTKQMVILDNAAPDQPGVWLGRSFADAPDIDAMVYVTETDTRLSAGQLVECEIVQAADYDLVAAAL